MRQNGRFKLIFEESFCWKANPGLRRRGRSVSDDPGGFSPRKAGIFGGGCPGGGRRAGTRGTPAAALSPALLARSGGRGGAAPPLPPHGAAQPLHPLKIEKTLQKTQSKPAIPPRRVWFAAHKGREEECPPPVQPPRFYCEESLQGTAALWLQLCPPSPDPTRSPLPR